MRKMKVRGGSFLGLSAPQLQSGRAEGGVNPGVSYCKGSARNGSALVSSICAPPSGPGTGWFFDFTRTEPDSHRGWIAEDKGEVVAAFQELKRERATATRLLHVMRAMETPGTRKDWGEGALLHGSRKASEEEGE